MNTIKHNLASRERLMSWATIIVGCCIMAVGYVVFINPYNIVPGGVYGASIVLHNIFPGIQVGTFGYMFDVPLLIISFIFLGRNLGARTIVAAMLTPALMNALTLMVYPTPEAVRSLDPAALLGGIMDMSNHLIVTTIFGAILAGVGSGLIVKARGSSGGTDIVALLMQKYLGTPFSRSIMICDACVVTFGLVVFGFVGQTAGGASGIHLSFYSLIAIYIIARTISFVLNGSQNDKLLFIVSKNRRDELRDFILRDLDRTATIIDTFGLYTLDRNTTLLLVVKDKEARAVKQLIREVDPTAFVIITDASATYGEGWSELPSKDELIPE